MEEAKLKRYLLGELFWELDQHESRPVDFASGKQELVEVLSFRGYDDFRVRIADAIYDIHLSWRKDVPPDIRRVDHVAA
jgi:hypothetical protein